MRGALATKQSRVAPRKDSGLLRGARHRAALRADPLARNDDMEEARRKMKEAGLGPASSHSTFDLVAYAWLAISLPSAACAAARRAIGTR
ncbi:hypothetical protein EAS62_36490 [Bradyrhizobium zhanjiangense]|uniref:Uncharacterized protein n=1 Tax=Bradyrhizobium zhanjiangense TaxID=1325107 RepID=A0ABY0D9L5_9BRAD|nr:hypothetical protein EAS62_36490 [Bradyrhizobium zhanjiangense]